MALVIQRATGKNQHFVFTSRLDLETAVRILQHLCGAKKLSPVSDELTASSKSPPLPSETTKQSIDPQAEALFRMIAPPQADQVLRYLGQEVDALAGPIAAS